MATEQRLIDANKLVDKLWQEECRTMTRRDFVAMVDYAPTIEDRPVVHGQWLWMTEDIYRCTNCNAESHVKEVMGKPVWGFCPECGSLMDGGADNG